MELGLDPIERDLILRYGHPFPAFVKALGARGRVTVSRFDLEQLVGELSLSINHGDVPDEWLDSVDALCEKIEQELRRDTSTRS